MEKSVIVKYIFLVVIGLFLLTVAMINIFGSGDNDEITEEDFESTVSTNDFNSVDGSNIDKEVNETEAPKEENQDVEEFISPPLMKDVYEEEFGKSNYDLAKQLTEKIMDQWIENPLKIDEYSGHISDEVMEDLLFEQRLMDGKTSNSLTNLDVYGLEQQDKERIRLGVSTSWHVIANGSPVSHVSRLYNVTLEEKDDTWIIVEWVDVANQDPHH